MFNYCLTLADCFLGFLEVEFWIELQSFREAGIPDSYYNAVSYQFVFEGSVVAVLC